MWYHSFRISYRKYIFYFYIDVHLECFSLCVDTPWDEPTLDSPEFLRYCTTPSLFSSDPWSRIPYPVRDLLLGLLALDPEKRWTTQSQHLRQDAWLCSSNPLLADLVRSVNPCI